MRYTFLLFFVLIGLVIISGCGVKDQPHQYTEKVRGDLTLSLGITRQDNRDGKHFTAKANLFNKSFKGIDFKNSIDKMLETNILDENGKPVSVDTVVVDQGSFGTPPGTNYGKSMRLKFKKQGAYTITCRLKGVSFGGNPIHFETDALTVSVK